MKALLAGKERRAVLLSVLLALVARLGYLLISGRLFHPETWEYESIALSILAGQGARYEHNGAVFMAFSTSALYPFLNAAVYWLTAHSQTAMALVQVALSTLTVWLVVGIGTRAVGLAAAVTAGVLYALHGPSLVYVGKLHPLVLDTLFTALVLFGTVLLRERRSASAAAFAGLMFGLGILTRPSLLVLLPLALGWALWRRFDARSLARAGVVVVIATAVLLPWTLRNVAVLGAPVFVASTSAENLWIGNNPAATGGSLTPQGEVVVQLASPQLQAAISQADEMGRYRLYERSALEYIAADPTGFLKRTADKLLYFWWFNPASGLEYPARWIAIYRVLYTLYLLTALVGVWSVARSGTGREKGLAILLIGSMALLSVGQSVFYVEERHRWLIEPFLLLYSGRGCVVMFRLVQRSMFGRLALGAAAIAPSRN
ncbi:MAG TPA: glycosyltransferase family 39 protein [Chloroflexota bacterium]|nr:glycosyltransferase family 39 protein [Chloroflexota bacterium]